MEPSNIPLRPTLARLELEAPPACQTLLPPQVEAAAPPLPACLTLPPPSAAMVVSAAAAAPRRSPYSLRLHNLLHARNGGASRVLQHSSRVTPRRTLDPGGEPLRRRQACLREGRAHHRRAGEHSKGIPTGRMSMRSRAPDRLCPSSHVRTPIPCWQCSPSHRIDATHTPQSWVACTHGSSGPLQWQGRAQRTARAP